METATPALPAVGDGATIAICSDAYPATVTAVTPTTITVQEDDSTFVPDAPNDDSRYTFKRNETGRVYKFSLRKNGRWVLQGARAGLTLVPGVRRYHLDPTV